MEREIVFSTISNLISCLNADYCLWNFGTFLCKSLMKYLQEIVVNIAKMVHKHNFSCWLYVEIHTYIHVRTQHSVETGHPLEPPPLSKFSGTNDYIWSAVIFEFRNSKKFFLSFCLVPSSYIVYEYIFQVSKDLSVDSILYLSIYLHIFRVNLSRQCLRSAM